MTLIDILILAGILLLFGAIGYGSGNDTSPRQRPVFPIFVVIIGAMLIFDAITAGKLGMWLFTGPWLVGAAIGYLRRR